MVPAAAQLQPLDPERLAAQAAEAVQEVVGRSRRGQHDAQLQLGRATRAALFQGRSARSALPVPELPSRIVVDDLARRGKSGLAWEFAQLFGMLAGGRGPQTTAWRL